MELRVVRAWPDHDGGVLRWVGSIVEGKIPLDSAGSPESPLGNLSTSGVWGRGTGWSPPGAGHIAHSTPLPQGWSWGHAVNQSCGAGSHGAELGSAVGRKKLLHEHHWGTGDGDTTPRLLHPKTGSASGGENPQIQSLLRARAASEPTSPHGKV